MNEIIHTACQQMKTHGFDGYYKSLVSQYSAIMNTRYKDFNRRTGRATRPLTSLNDALYYSVAYANSHYVTFRHVFADQLPTLQVNAQVNIIDYGCGQGTATMALLEQLAATHNPATLPLMIYLIEPSDIALQHAHDQIVTLAQALGFSGTINVQHCTLANAILPPDNGAVTFHLMSYILDVPTVQAQLKTVTRQIQQRRGHQIVIATDINCSHGHEGLHLLSQQLTGRVRPIKHYTPQHYSYRLTTNQYEQFSANAIGMVICL